MKLLALSALFFVSIHAENHEHLLSYSKLNGIADHVNNNEESTWKATKFHSLHGGEDYINPKLRVGVLEESMPQDVANTRDGKANQCVDNGLPKEFDARKHWPECSSVISHIYDQGNCGACWAVSAASVFSDRVCIASKGKKKALFSGQQLLTCCHKCTGHSRDGCNGGWPIGAFSYIKRNGLTTGGDYKSKQGCQPYQLGRCDHHVNGSLPMCSSLPSEKAPKCKLHCYNYSYDKTFKQDRIKAEKYYQVAPCGAMNEIYHRGPILAEFTVFEDFYTYKSGVYKYITGERTGRHAVRVIGWGEENGVPYWLIANSWNTHWGDNGTIKIKRGDNEVWIEDAFSAVLPKL